MKTCYTCKKVVELLDRPRYRETCEHCDSDLHTCHNCAFYDEHMSRQCKENQAQLVSDKDKYNYCDFFEFAGGSSDRLERAERAKTKLEDLFKK